MKINPFLVVDTLDELKRFYNFSNDFILPEEDYDVVRFFEDLNNRRILDASVLSLFASNVSSGNMLDIGTYKGNSAARMALNSPESKIYTVNIHPDEIGQGGIRVTGAPSIEEIGSYYRALGLKNVEQIYANTINWEIPDDIANLKLVYIDGSHDKEVVLNDTKLVIDRVDSGGFILWHDCSPIYRNNYEWINDSMLGIEAALDQGVILNPYVLNLKNSWIGIWQKR